MGGVALNKVDLYQENLKHRIMRAWHGLLLSILLAVSASCTGAAPVAPTTSVLGARAGSDPLAVVEGYLQQYQPGPLPRVFQTTRIYDRHGTPLAELYDEGRRTWLPLSRISPYLVSATISTEDATFYQNRGVDTRRALAALLRNLREGEIVSGASTITMQLARNLFLGPDARYDQSLDRKLLEAGLAQELTNLYAKDEILEMYLNLLNYGNLAYGPEAAAQLYFGKAAADLTAAEATFLAGIPQAPALLDPYTNFDGVRQRQRVVLDLMVRHGALGERAADFIFEQPLTLQERRLVGPNLAPHFVQYVTATLDQQLGRGYVRRAGFRITTTLDLPLQQLAQTLVRRQVDELRNQFDLNNAALVAMKPHTGEILVMVGSADFNNPAIAGQVNVATRLRQPGSAIKPVLYATALNDNLVSPATVLWDVPASYRLDDGQRYQPRNYDERFHGPVTVRSALANSYNVATVRLLAGLGVERMLQSARALGIQSLNQPVGWYGLSLTLGGGDVTLLDLTTAYHTLASEGRYLPPRAVLALTDVRGNTSNLNWQPAALPVLTHEAAFLVTDILNDNEARTPMFGANSPLRLSRPAAVKTGTTTDFRDNWTIGYTRYLVAGVWAGNSDGRPMRNTSGLTGAAPIWHDFMQAVIDDPAMLAVLDAPVEPGLWGFAPPASVEQRPDCAPGVVCRNGGEFFSQDWLALAGERGPLGDTVERVATAPVYVETLTGSRQAGFCTLEGAAERTVLRLPGSFGLPAPFMGAGGEGAAWEPNEYSADLSGAVNPQLVTPGNDTGNEAAAVGFNLEPVAQERIEVMAWTLQYGTPVHLGRCEELDELAPLALDLVASGDRAQMRILVDLAAAGNPELSEWASAGAVEVAALSGLIAGNDIPVASGRYRLAAPIVHDTNCPGAYLMGRVLNLAGEPVPGVAIQFRDQWGNGAGTVSKSGAYDFGMFDFPIPSSSPHEMYVWVVDGAGNPISPTITIQHRQGEAPDAPCHHVVLQGG
jgi:penicillin-binding protein 1C